MAAENDVLRRLIRFAGVGGFCFVLTLAVNYGLKLTVLGTHPTTAFLIANCVATVVSFLLSRHYTFQGRNSALAKRYQAPAFVIVSALAVVINSAPLYLSRWVFGFHTPRVSLWVQETADFLAGPIIGTLLAMVFRWWALHRFVFPEQLAGTPTPRADVPA
ncbi:GtrA family protein [Glutamicibacter sp. X7]